MNRTKVILTLLAVALVYGTAGVASGATLYQDSFDNVPVGNSPSPQVGTYLGGQALVRTGYVASPSVPNYLDNDRTIGQMDYYGDLLGGSLLPGAVVHAELDVFAISGYSNWGLIESGNIVNPHDPVNGAGIIIVSTAPDGGVLAINSAGALVSTGLTHQFNTGQKWQIDYTVGSSNYNLTIGANSANLGAAYMKDTAKPFLSMRTVNKVISAWS